MRIDQSLGIACGNLVEPAGTDWTRISIPRSFPGPPARA